MDIVSITFGIVILLIIAIIVTLSFSIKIVQPYEAGLLLTFGKFQRVLPPGLNIVPPIISKVIIMDLRTQQLQIPYTKIIIKDGKTFDKSVIVHFKITDPKKVYLKMPEYKNEIINLTQKKLRDKISR